MSIFKNAHLFDLSLNDFGSCLHNPIDVGWIVESEEFFLFALAREISFVVELGMLVSMVARFLMYIEVDVVVFSEIVKYVDTCAIAMIYPTLCCTRFRPANGRSFNR